MMSTTNASVVLHSQRPYEAETVFEFNNTQPHAVTITAGTTAAAAVAEEAKAAVLTGRKTLFLYSHWNFH